MTTHAARMMFLIQATLLSIPLVVCAGAPQTETAAPNAPAAAPSTAVATSAAATGALPGTAASASPEAAAGPPPASSREIRGYFTQAATRESLRFWRGPNDTKGWERLTRFTVEINGEPVYSMAISAIEFAGVCRSAGKGLDQLLLYFHPERRGGGGFGVFRCDSKKRRFTLGFTPADITQDGTLRVDCTGGRSLLPEGSPSLPCTCPWADDPEAPAATSSGGSAAEAREILILPEQAGGPAFTPRDTAGGAAGTGPAPGGPGAGTAADDAEENAAIPDEVAEYAAVLADFKAGKTTLESLLAAGDRAQKALIPPGEEYDPLEHLSEEDHARVQKAMEGFAVGGADILYVVPDPGPMLALARAHGDAADVAYFERLAQTTNGVWPVYTEQISEYGRCTKYGGKEIVAAYRRWTDFAHRFPGRYSAEVASEIDSASRSLTDGDYACGDRDTVLQELTAFVEEFPAAAITAEVRRQIEAIKSGTSKLRFDSEPR